MSKLLLAQNYEAELQGIASIATYVKRHGRHEVKIAIEGDADIVEAYRAFEPDVVGLGALTKDHNWVLEVSDRIKAADADAFILVGGPHPTFYPRLLEHPSVDAICVGEGEKPVLKLLDRLAAGEDHLDIPSLWFSVQGATHKNEVDTPLGAEDIPIPDRTAYDGTGAGARGGALEGVCSRGCPFNCSFCVNRGLRELYGKGFFRVREIDDIVSEIVEARRLRNVETIHFQDDIFGHDKAWLRDFLSEYKAKVDLPFYCLLRCEVVSEDLVDDLIAAGCFEVGIGIESGDEEVRNRVLNKKLKEEAIVKAAGILRKKGLSFHTFNMFSLPGEGLSEAFKTLDLNLKIKPDIGWSALFQPYPGTEFFDERSEAAMLRGDFNRFEVNFPYSKQHKQIQRLQKFFMLTIRYPFLRPLLPVLVRLPFDRWYDSLSKSAWHHIYGKKLGK